VRANHTYSNEEADMPDSKWLHMQQPDFYLDGIFQPQQTEQMQNMLKNDI
jgi:hypothetical protein